MIKLSREERIVFADFSKSVTATPRQKVELYKALLNNKSEPTTIREVIERVASGNLRVSLDGDNSTPVDDEHDNHELIGQNIRTPSFVACPGNVDAVFLAAYPIVESFDEIGQRLLGLYKNNNIGHRSKPNVRQAMVPVL